MADISLQIGGVNLETCVFNAAGPHDVTFEELEVIAKSASSAVTMKSCTLEPRFGNPEPRYADLPEGSINSMGLPNLGYKEYLRFTRILKERFNKPVVASICGLTLEDNLTMFEAFSNSPADIIEFNPGSPNTIGKPIMGYDTDFLDKSLQKITRVCRKPMGIKLPPYFDFMQFEQISSVLKKYDIKYISCINSIGNALVIDAESERPLIAPKGGFGGLGGKYVKFTALANVRKFHELVGDKIKMIGCGGVYTGTDAFEYILAGASGVQVGTAFIQQGPLCFARIQRQLREIMERKGYRSLDDFRGKLKVLD